jgi:iron complex outermembrane receptor protein
MRLSRRLLGISVGIVLSTLRLCGQQLPDVTTMSLEDLMNVRITSVTKRAQKLGEAAAAIFVITQDDIRRSGARNIPEALRLAPGLEVARIDQNKWAITARGFNNRYANKLLVLIDGRSIYTPLFSGVYWAAQDLLLEDVDRIEIVRGPGATLWGANAVNGVINIITRNATETTGGRISGNLGNDELGQGSIRFGGLSGNTFFRTYSKYYDWKSSKDELGIPAFDRWHSNRAGFRIDHAPASEDTLTVQGDIYTGRYGDSINLPQLTPPYSTTQESSGAFSGGNLLGRWNHLFAGSALALQVYVDKTNTADDNVIIDHQNTYDLDLQHEIQISETHQLLWGAGYRSIQDAADSSSLVVLSPDHRGRNLFNAFAQDELAFLGERLHVTLGTKIEHNDFTGFEVEPNIRSLWALNSHQSVWGAISRAVRTPSRTEEDIRLITGVTPPSAASQNLPVEIEVVGNPQIKSEDLLAYEAGYRGHISSRWSLDASMFYNSYNHLLSAEPQSLMTDAVSGPLHMVAPFLQSNKRSGTTYGGELFATWKPAPSWKISGTYSFLQMRIHPNSDSRDPFIQEPNGASPKHQYYLRSSVDLPKHFEEDLTIRYVARLNGLAIPEYYSVDAHVVFRPAKRLELSVGGWNLFDNRHLEFRPDFITTVPTQAGRSLQSGLTWSF